VDRFLVFLGLSLTIIAPASDGIRRYLEATKVVQPDNFGWFIADIILLALGVIVLALGIVFWVLEKRKNKSLDSSIASEVNLSDALPDHLRQLDDRMWQLKEKQVNRFVTVRQLNEVSTALNNYCGISNATIADKQNKVKKMISRQKAQSKFDPRSIFAKLLSDTLSKAVYTSDTLKGMVNILDGFDIGLSKARNHDKKWNSIYAGIQQIVDTYKDNILTHHVDDFILWSNLLNSILLFDQYGRKIIPADWMPTEILASDASDPKSHKGHLVVAADVIQIAG